MLTIRVNHNYADGTYSQGNRDVMEGTTIGKVCELVGLREQDRVTVNGARVGLAYGMKQGDTVDVYWERKCTMYVITKEDDAMESIVDVLGVFLHRQAAEVAYVEHVTGALKTEPAGLDWYVALHEVEHGWLSPVKQLIQVDGMREGKRVHQICDKTEGIAV